MFVFKRASIVIILLSLSLNSQTKYSEQTTYLLNKATENTYKDKDSVYFYANKLIKLSQSNKNWSDYIEALFKINDAALYTYDFNAANSSLRQLDSIFSSQKVYIDKLSNTLSYYNYLNYYHGVYHYILNDYETAIVFFNDILVNTSKIPEKLLTEDNKFEISVAYSRIGKMYTDEGKYDRAKALYKKNIRFLNTHYKDNKDLLYSIYNLLAEVLKKEGDFKNSNAYLLKTFRFHKKINSKNSIITSAFNISENYSNLSKNDSAQIFLNIAKSHIEKDNKYTSKYHEIQATIFSKKGEFLLAKTQLDSAMVFLKSMISNRKHSKIGQLYNKMGELNLKYNFLDNALLKFNLAENEFSNELNLSAINKTILFKILKNKAITQNSLENENSALEISNKATLILDDLKPSFKSTNDKLLLSEFAFPFYENAIESAYTLHKKTNNKKYIETAFLFSEKSKGSFLLESLLSIKASSFSKIPDSLINEEKRLKSKIAYLEKKYRNTSDANITDELYTTKETYFKLIDVFEKKYKNYYDLKYNSKVVNVNEVQNRLAPQSVLLNIFYGKKHIYIFKISKSDKKIIRHKNSKKLELLITQCYNLLSNPDSDISVLNSKTFKLYSTILKPILNDDSNKNLIIISDGLLNFIPFGSLSISSSRLEYMIQKYHISYINSATLLYQLQDKKKNNNSILAFAPEFKNNKNNLLPLPNNTREVKNILNYFKGSSYINSDATLERFNELNTDYSVLHLATHAIYDNVNPESSYLAFASNNSNDYLLFVNDLYNLELNADMVTLSACDSGIGKLKKGTGLLSIARGFYFSGAASISSTLWKINDAASVTLMNNFYKNLSKGLYKDEALQKSKLSFIKANKDNALSHPYYWSSFIISGNITPLTSNNMRVYLCFGLIITVLLVLFIGKFKLPKLF
ncbi:MAG: CHAT domain-containing protein [Winogradskyella sp.]|nr:MAG: CHAT domain-containing protein [Winogradskyella sp.]